MGIIHLLNENVSNKIAAGEVIERPASVVKELVENSIDAGASSITVEIKDGGITYIRVTDNGSGMDMGDAKNSFIRHATSKIECEDDLFTIKTLGFRGEALASIASVSEVELVTKLKDEVYGTRIYIEGGEYKFVDSTGCPDGTTFIVKNLFYNTPARLKFLKKETREAAVISEVLSRLALSKPSISFKFINSGKLIFNTNGDGDPKNAILTIFGKDYMNSLINVSYKGNILSISGFIGCPEAARSNRNMQIFYVNNRYIRSKMISAAVDSAYKTFLPVNKFAFCLLFIHICPELVDVNVHPTKAEVRFQDEKEVFSAVFSTIRNGLAGHSIIPEIIKDDQTVELEQQKLIYSDLSFMQVPGKEKNTETIHESRALSQDRINYSNPVDMKESTKEEIRDIGRESINIDENEAHNLLPPLLVLGQCHYTYILAQGPDGLYIIDQHAAHERVLYEKFRHSFENGEIQSQKLLTPLVLDLTSDEICTIKDNNVLITKLGFDIEFFGNNSVILRSVPILFGSPQLKKLFLDIVDSFDNSYVASKRSHVDNILYTLACKSAIKANDRLGLKEMEELISMLRKTLNPYTCPHGRPTIIKLTRDELERKFKRIQ